VVAVKQGKEMTVGGLVKIRAGEAAIYASSYLSLATQAHACPRVEKRCGEVAVVTGASRQTGHGEHYR
jgi:hypothetical protein